MNTLLTWRILAYLDPASGRVYSVKNPSNNQVKLLAERVTQMGPRAYPCAFFRW
jgi:hypothetical protein